MKTHIVPNTYSVRVDLSREGEGGMVHNTHATLKAALRDAQQWAFKGNDKENGQRIWTVSVIEHSKVRTQTLYRIEVQTEN